MNFPINAIQHFQPKEIKKSQTDQQEMLSIQCSQPQNFPAFWRLVGNYDAVIFIADWVEILYFSSLAISLWIRLLCAMIVTSSLDEIW
jgi:hypothetical protein